MLAVAGYSGFRRRNEDCELIKPDPGVSEAERHKKFAVAATAVLSKPAELTAQFGTVTASASIPIKPTDYKVPPRSGAAPRLAPDAKFVGQSLYSATYPDYFRDAFKLKEHTASEYEAAFRRIDTDNSGFITLDEIATLLNDVLGKAPSDFQIQSFMAFFDENRDGRVSWVEFQKGLEVVSETMLATTRAAKPSGTPVSRKAPTPKVIGPASVRSSYESDVTGVTAPASATFGGTTKDLAGGTSKMTAHVPGYSGYLPESGYSRNSKALAHASGSSVRDVFDSKTNLNITFARSLPGYTGHLPSNTGSASGVAARTGGIYAPTETAASAGMIERYWEARKAGSGAV